MKMYVKSENILKVTEDSVCIATGQNKSGDKRTATLSSNFIPALWNDYGEFQGEEALRKYSDFEVNIPDDVAKVPVTEGNGSGVTSVKTLKKILDIDTDYENRFQSVKYMYDAVDKNAAVEKKEIDARQFHLPAMAIQYIDSQTDGKVDLYCSMPRKDEMDRFVIIEKDFVHGLPVNEIGKIDEQALRYASGTGVAFPVVIDANVRKQFMTQLNYGDEKHRLKAITVDELTDYYNEHCEEMQKQGMAEAIRISQEDDIAMTMAEMTPEEREAYEQELLEDRLSKMSDEERQKYYAKVREEEIEAQKMKAKPKSPKALHLRISNRFMLPFDGYFAVAVPDEESSNNRGVFFVGNSQVYIAEKKTGEPMPGRYDVFFKDGDKSLSYMTTNEDGMNKVTMRTPHEIIAKYQEAEKKGLTMPNVQPVAEIVYDNDREMSM